MVHDSLVKAFTADTVEGLAGSRSYRRGVSYYSDGRVEPAGGGGPGLQARVRGTMPYTVRLWVTGGMPGWSCTCPAAEDGSFCKHCVAVALSVDPDTDRSPAVSFLPVPDSSSSPVADQELAGFVGQLPKSRLVEVVLQQAASDWRLRERLLAEARARRGDGLDVDSWRRYIDNAFEPHDRYVSYREAEGWADGVRDVIGALEDICDTGHPDAVVLLAEYAHRRADQALEYVDDLDGWLFLISSRLCDLHHRACSEGSPDPAELAARLVELELDPELDGFYRSAATYAEILGDEGLVVYRERLDVRRRRTEARRDDGAGAEIALGRIQEAMVGWAIGTGDTDVLIEVHSRVRLHPRAAMEIVAALTADNRVDEALEWARRGLRENRGPYHHTADLREYLAGALHDRGDSSGAVQLFWDAFSADPSLATYRHLIEQVGEDSGVRGGWAERCVEELRARLAQRVAETDWVRRRIVASAREALLKILLFEGRIDEAWHAATEFGCDSQMWLTLARAREQTHPLDAIAVYKPEVLDQIDRKKTPAYKKAVELMDRVRRLADAADEPHHFTDLLDRVRTEHSRKRNLKALLDGRGW
ncbi:MAG: SWIM zinc finger family protein [bacterium]|nr:SWIM zinc finger family protein [bacterium]